MKDTNAAASAVRNKLKAMDLENKEFAKRNEGASEARIRSNMHGEGNMHVPCAYSTESPLRKHVSGSHPSSRPAVCARPQLPRQPASLAAGTLTRKFVDLMAEYQEIQTRYKNKYRERGALVSVRAR